MKNLYEEQKAILRDIVKRVEQFELQEGDKISLGWLVCACRETIAEIETEQRVWQ